MCDCFLQSQMRGEMFCCGGEGRGEEGEGRQGLHIPQTDKLSGVSGASPARGSQAGLLAWEHSQHSQN